MGNSFVCKEQSPLHSSVKGFALYIVGRVSRRRPIEESIGVLYLGDDPTHQTDTI